MITFLLFLSAAAGLAVSAFCSALCTSSKARSAAMARLIVSASSAGHFSSTLSAGTPKPAFFTAAAIDAMLAAPSS